MTCRTDATSKGEEPPSVICQQSYQFSACEWNGNTFIIKQVYEFIIQYVK